MCEWRIAKTRDLIDGKLLIIGDGYRAKNSELRRDGIPFVRAGNINNGGFDFSTVDFFPKNELAKVGEKISKDGDVVFTSKGTVGRIAFVKQQTPQFVYSPQLCFWRSLDFKKIYPPYLYYWMQSHSFHAQIAGVKGQTDMADYVSLRDQREMEIALPDINEQIVIAKTLMPLDAKITLLRRQNETLEQITQALFKHWFVDFEFPYDFARGKPDSDASGQPYKSSGGKMVDSELGEIPAGWRVGKSSDLINLQGGFAFKSEFFKKSGNHRIIKIKNIQNHVIDILNSDFVDEEVVQNLDRKFKIHTGDFLIAMTGAEVAKVGIVPRTEENLWLNQRVGLFRNRVKYGTLFIYYLFSKPEYQKALRDKGSGSSAQPNISAKDIESIETVVPDKEVLFDFGDVVKPLFQKTVDNLHHIYCLSKTRDTLLPKLMSGQVRVKA